MVRAYIATALFVTALVALFTLATTFISNEGARRARDEMAQRFFAHHWADGRGNITRIHVDCDWQSVVCDDEGR